MERLVIVVDCPDEWRERGWIDPVRVRLEIMGVLDRPLPVRVRWQSLDAEAL
jgi:hypothetical protein